MGFFLRNATIYCWNGSDGYVTIGRYEHKIQKLCQYFSQDFFIQVVGEPLTGKLFSKSATARHQ